MADTKISALSAASTLDGTELLAGVQSAANVKITGSQVKTYTLGSPTQHGVVLGAAAGALSYLAVAAAGTILTGVASSDPAFSATPVLGVAGTTLGTLGLSGNTSGVVSIKPQAAAGTYNLNLPTTAGSSGDILTSGGGGSAAMTWTTPVAINALTDNYNNSGTIFTTIGAIISGNSYAAGTRLISFTQNSVEAFGVSPDGGIHIDGGSPKIFFQGESAAQFSSLGAGYISGSYNGDNVGIKFGLVTSSKTANDAVLLFPSAAASGLEFNNLGASGTVNLTIDSFLRVGMHAGFMVAAAQTLTITAPTGVTLRSGAVVSSTGGTLSSSTVGNYVHLLVVSSTLIIATSVIGTWTGA